MFLVTYLHISKTIHNLIHIEINELLETQMFSDLVSDLTFQLITL